MTSIRAILTRPLPPPRRTVGTVALAMTLTVTANFLQAQDRIALRRRVDTLTRESRRSKKTAAHALQTVTHVQGMAVDGLDSAIITARRLDATLVALRAQGIDVPSA